MWRNKAGWLLVGVVFLGLIAVLTITSFVGDRSTSGGAAQSGQSLAPTPESTPSGAERAAAEAAEAGAAAERDAQALATVTAQVAAAQAQGRTAVLRTYSTKAAQQLQRYADARGAFIRTSLEASERPALLLDAGWRSRSAAALETMQRAADELTSISPVPPDMVPVAALFTQIAAETARLREDHARRIDGDQVDASTAGAVATRISDLVTQANRDVRRAAP